MINKLEELPSRKAVKKAIEKNRVLLNGEIGKTGDFVKFGDVIELLSDDLKITPYKLKIDVIFENQEYAVVVKPSGLKVSGNEHINLQNTLSYNLQKSLSKDALHIPRPCHRLDKATSGLLLIAKTYSFLRYALDLFENRKIQKRYEAIVVGSIESEGIVELSIDEKEATSKYQLIKKIDSVKNGVLSWVSLFPKTGRKHQLRKHLQSIGNPILGDQLYHPEGKLKHKGLFLAAVELTFEDREGVIQNFNIDAPDKFYSLWKREESWNHRMQLKADLISIIEKYDFRMSLLKTLSEELPEGYISAGFIRNTVWDELHESKSELEDVDVIYLNPKSTNKSIDVEIEGRLKSLHPNVNWSVKNQARMAINHGHEPYESIKEAMSYWPETATSIAIRLIEGELELLYSYGLTDLFSLTLKKSEKGNRDLFLERVEKKNWLTKWPKLKVLDDE